MFACEYVRVVHILEKINIPTYDFSQASWCQIFCEVGTSCSAASSGTQQGLLENTWQAINLFQQRCCAIAACEDEAVVMFSTPDVLLSRTFKNRYIVSDQMASGVCQISANQQIHSVKTGVLKILVS